MDDKNYRKLIDTEYCLEISGKKIVYFELKMGTMLRLQEKYRETLSPDLEKLNEKSDKYDAKYVANYYNNLFKICVSVLKPDWRVDLIGYIKKMWLTKHWLYNHLSIAQLSEFLEMALKPLTGALGKDTGKKKVM